MGLTVTIEDRIATLTMAMPGGNAIGHAFIEDMHAELDAIEASDARAVVLTGQGSMFGSGLDLLGSFDYDRAQMLEFVAAFEGLFVRLFAFPLPMVAAINGHAVAGGAVMAFAADYRIVTSGKAKLGITEVQVGIPFPSGAMEISRHALPRGAHADCFLGGVAVSPAEALAMGMVHATAAPEELMDRALAKARVLSAGGLEAIRIAKADLRAPTLERIERNRVASQERFVDHWLSEEGCRRRGAIRDDLLARRAGKPA